MVVGGCGVRGIENMEESFDICMYVCYTAKDKLQCEKVM